MGSAERPGENRWTRSLAAAPVEAEARARIEAALDSMLTNPAEPSLAEVIAGSGWSERQFRRRFQEAVGIGPKLFSRILRFQRALHAIDRSGLLPAALECGYFDQAHFIHDFRSFASETPAAYASRTHPLADHFRGAAIHGGEPASKQACLEKPPSPP